MSVVTVMPRSTAFTRADLEAMPDDGHRYELIDGSIVVTPAPRPLHQRALGQLYRALAHAAPPEFEVLFAPLDVVLAEDTVVQPDLLVARRRDFSAGDLPVPPLLAVEILSPSTRLVDLTLKRARYEEAGCPAYWVVDPDVPSITAWELRGKQYELAAEAAGDEVLDVSLPFAVVVVPARLVE